MLNDFPENLLIPTRSVSEGRFGSSSCITLMGPARGGGSSERALEQVLRRTLAYEPSNRPAIPAVLS